MNTYPSSTSQISRPTLQTGDTGNDVMELQKLLSQQGPDTPVDGNFDSTTLAAVISFQQRKGLLVDGIVGPKTWAVLQGSEAQE
ncbi:MAG: hypothetical protein Kow00121_67150 [Elainellaceae cyanobacterium]